MASGGCEALAGLSGFDARAAAQAAAHQTRTLLARLGRMRCSTVSSAGVAKDPNRVAWIGPTLVALVLLSTAVAAITVTLGRAPSESFPTDHGVTDSCEEWVRCAAETIEAHPGTFAAQNGFEIETAGPRWIVVRSGLLTTRLEMADGHLAYWRFGGWHSVPWDCPGVRPENH